MVALSVVVPARNVQGYVRQCLSSVLDQGGVEVQLIVVDDCSTDGTSEILAEFASSDGRVKLVRPQSNIGLGPARNLGLAHATGDYVLFLDSDDFLYPGALSRISDRCDETGADIVIYDYDRLYWNDRHERNARADLLARHPGVFTLADDPEFLMLLNVAWNKAYRREFLEDAGLLFPGGYYEDIPWTYPLLCMASSIATLNAVCLAYRQRRGGSILRTVDDRHFEVLTQIDRLLAMADQDPRVGEFRTELWERGAGHALGVLAHSKKRLPRGGRRKLFFEAGSLLRAQKPEKYSLLKGGSRRKVELLLAGRYGAFQAAKLGNQIRFMGRRGARRCQRKSVSAKRRLYAAATSVARNQVRPDLALFSSLWGRQPSGNPLAISRKLSELAPHVDVVWAVTEQVASELDQRIPHVVIGTPKYYRCAAKARWLVNDVNFDDQVRRRPGQTFLQTQHGTPLKFMGLDLLSRPVAAGGMNFEKLMRRVDQWTHNLSSNRYSSEVWARAFPSRYQMLEYGYPRNDVLLNPPEGLRSHVRAELGIGDDELVVLFLPTHREGVDYLQFGFDPYRLLDQIGRDFTLFVRGHYFYGPGGIKQGARPNQRLLDLSSYPEVEHLYLASDVLLTDYSSAMFDYANLGKPIVIYAHDWEQYRVTRGTYFDITEDAPGEVAMSLADLVDIFRSRSFESSESSERLSRFQGMFCEMDDGMASERVVRSLFLGETVVSPDQGLPSARAIRSWALDRPS